MTCVCHIVPKHVLDVISTDRRYPVQSRHAAAMTSRISEQLRGLRTQALAVTATTQLTGSHLITLAAQPDIVVYDCMHTQTLPGRQVANPKSSRDQPVKRAFTATTGVAEFYRTIFHRNSLDNAGMTLVSSVHYGRNFNNAMWNGSQMLYGDGDGKIFVDFTRGDDVIGHELTHGVTQHTLQLSYSGDAGGLNESMSDCFGAMFQQWESKQDVNRASWLIGARIMGAAAKARGFRSLRNMANPADKACLAPQPVQYSQITPGMDPHYSSGPPNLAFCTACKAAGGYSWESVGQVWYDVLTTSGSQPNMTMRDFATRTRQAAHQLFPNRPAIVNAVDHGWKVIGL